MRLIEKIRNLLAPKDGGMLEEAAKRKEEQEEKDREARRLYLEEMHQHRMRECEEMIERRQEAKERLEKRMREVESTRANLRLLLTFHGEEVVIEQAFEGSYDGGWYCFTGQILTHPAEEKAKAFEAKLKEEITSKGYTTETGTFYPPHALIRIDRIALKSWTVPEEAIQQASLDVAEAS